MESEEAASFRFFLARAAPRDFGTIARARRSETAMFLFRRLIFPSFFVAGALMSVPVFAAPVTKKLPRFTAAISLAATQGAPNQSAWKYAFAEDDLENRWSFRGQAKLAGEGEIRVVFGWKNAKNTALLTLARTKNGVEGALIPLVNGKIAAGKTVARFQLPTTQGEIGLQKIGNRTRVLWNGNVVAQANFVFPGAQFGTATRGSAKLVADAPQPTENVIFRDDFMRAEGPDETEIPGEWKVAGLWKTSGSLGPRSDAALNPNPFVFRAQTPTAIQKSENIARAGKWWWGNYSVSASVRATKNEANVPLRAAIEAFSQGNGAGVRGEVDFSRGIVALKSGSKVLAQNRVAIEANQWHRLRLEPGPGVAKFWVDGVLCVQAPSQLAQGGVALRAFAGKNALVDFDDVRVGKSGGAEWGEGALPERFQKDRLMGNWASNAKSWSRDSNGIWWHTGDFFGDFTLSVPLQSRVFEAGADIQVISAAGAQGAKQLIAQVTASEWKTLRASQATLQVSYQAKLHPNAVLTRLNGTKRPLTIYPTRPRGHKIGLRFMKNGQPLPAPKLQKISLQAATFEREKRAAIGVNLTPISAEIARQIGLSDVLGAIVDNVEADSPAQKAGVFEGDVIRGVDGARVIDVDSMRTAVGAVKPGQVLKLAILRPQSDSSGLDWAQSIASTPDLLDYSFTAAPTDWRAARGTWDVSERWTCSPQWSFFAGQNDASPLLWSRFATRGDWTLEAYLATPMDLTRGERSPTDLNLTVGANGQDLSSGYSFIFAGKNRSVNQIRRGDSVAWEKPFEMPPSAGDIHQDWFYVRLEKRQTAQGARFRYSVNGQVMADYLDPKPLPDGGHIGFWTQNGAMSIARVRLWHSGLREPQKMKDTSDIRIAQIAKTPIANSTANALGNWSARGQGSEASAQLISLNSAEASKNGKTPNAKTLQITNPKSGGDWTTFVTRSRFSVAKTPVLEWDYRVPSGVKVNLYAQIDGVWREIGFTGANLKTDDNRQLGRVEGVSSDGKWHRARFDLQQALRNQSINGASVDALAFAAPDQDYLRAGLGGNRRGATYWLRNFSAIGK